MKIYNNNQMNVQRLWKGHMHLTTGGKLLIQLKENDSIKGKMICLFFI